jgi:hypothetical protein
MGERKALERIQQSIKSGSYDFTHHAVEEMAEDELGIFDVEYAVLNGTIEKVIKNDPCGTKYTLNGPMCDKSAEVGVVGRFKETGTFLIITVYKIE